MQPPDRDHRQLEDDEFRAALRAVVARAGRSLRALSLAMGRDPGYLAALLDPSRPSRARPTPADLLALSDATAITLVELLEALWAVPRERLAGELERLEPGRGGDGLPGGLSPSDRRAVADFAAFLADRRAGRG